MNSYYHWLAMAWYITLTTNPAVSLPCGLDDNQLPFGLQIIGRFKGDGALLDIAEAMETEFASSTELAKPMPDISKLLEPVPALQNLVTDAPNPELVHC
ncbi:MAG: hypothetical protein CBC34_013000 [Hyphomicrobiaceae bacterium TMED74]|nr:MAG: hypothetical protein CBC34_013000 [Hyphomicrobiaceae bacterium TMED74]